MKTWKKVYIPYFNADYLVQYNIAVVYVKNFLKTCITACE